MSLIPTPLVTISQRTHYNFLFPCSKMSCNRFKLLLANLNFANNETIEEDGRVRKVLPLLNILTDNYQKIFSSGEDIVMMKPWFLGENDSYSGRISQRNDVPENSAFDNNRIKTRKESYKQQIRTNQRANL